MPSRFSFGIATVVMLVLLRLTIGWHFFSEGVKHYADPHWTAEPVLRAAKGPLAPLYRSYVSDFHGFDELLHGPAEQSDTHAVQSWSDAIQSDWDARLGQFVQHFDFNEDQQRQGIEILHRYQAHVRDWTTANKEALATHVHEWQRKETTREKPTGELPFERKRIADKQAQLTAEAAGWRAELGGIERDYENALDALATDEQHLRGPAPQLAGPIARVDAVMTYVILAVGLLLLLGLFTRTACVTGAVFLASVVMMQPFWISDAVPTFNQYVEMFALLTLATTHVGRWAGLDFFLAQLIHGSSSTKGKSDAPQS